MGAFSIAFDIIIVGALALPWVLLVIRLFFSDDENSLKNFMGWVEKQNQPAVAGVLLFAMTFSLGSAVSRIAQDFFDDDDLHFRLAQHLFQIGVTESSIRTEVFCQTVRQQAKGSTPQAAETSKPENTEAIKPSDPTAVKRDRFRNNDQDCKYTGRWVIRQGLHSNNRWIDHQWISEQEGLAEDVFLFQEATVLLKGTDATERLRQFHDQIMVLRGATFNAMVAFSLCLFWWIAKFQTKLRWAVLLLYLFPGGIASSNHLRNHMHTPPFMEFTLLALAAAGGYLLWHRRRRKKDAPAVAPSPNGTRDIRFGYLFLSLFLTVSAFLGWWATQVLYDQQVIYSYKSLSDAPREAATPSSK